MPGRTLLFVGLLIVAVAGPYLVSEGGLLQPRADGNAQGIADPFWKRLWSGRSGSGHAASAAGAATENGLATAGTATGETHTDVRTTLPFSDAPVIPLPGRPVAARQIAGPAGITLAEALRFDVSPQWVSQNWTRVTTQLADTDYQGMRVPLVTGTDPADVAGSLTYLFNSQGVADRISFVGTTGDFEPTGMYLQQLFGLQRYATVGPGLFLAFAGTQPLSIMYVENATIQSEDHPRTRFRIEIELNAPRPGASLSMPWQERLRRLRAAKAL